MIAAPDERCARYPQRRVDTDRDCYIANDKKNNTDIVNRRHSLAHINFRKAIYRSLSLPQVTDESNQRSVRSLQYLLIFSFVCVFLLVIGFLIRLIWLSQRGE